MSLVITNQERGATVTRLRDLYDVSRETLSLMDALAAEVRRWSKALNIVSKQDVDRIWSRHIDDSLALAPWLSSARSWVDLGSGGGFPALPLAVLAREEDRLQFTCVESDGRKAVFLQEIVRKLDLRVDVRTERIESLGGVGADIVSARALAAVDDLLDLAERGGVKADKFLFLKGARLMRELTKTSVTWHMSYQALRHPTASDGYILMIQDFQRAKHK